MANVLNLMGYLCPIPVFETRKALSKMQKGDELIIICDDSDVQYDIPKLAHRLSSEIINIKENEGVWEIKLLAP